MVLPLAYRTILEGRRPLLTADMLWPLSKTLLYGPLACSSPLLPVQKAAYNDAKLCTILKACEALEI